MINARYAARVIREWRLWLDRFGVAVGFTLAFCVGSLALRAQPPSTRDRWLDWASTNLVNLRHHPASAMVVSAFFAEHDLVAWAVLGFTGLAIAGWILGAGRTALLVAAAHVLGTLASEGILWWRIAAGAVPAAQEHIRDVGPSYVVISALAFGVLYAPWLLRAPAAIGFAILAPGSFGGLPHLELSALGHTCAVLIAAGLGWYLVRRRRSCENR